MNKWVIIDCSNKYNIILKDCCLKYNSINELINFLKENYNAIQNIGVVCGPGGFSSLRSSIALMKGLFFNTMVNIVEINLFDFCRKFLPKTNEDYMVLVKSIYYKPYAQVNNNIPFILDDILNYPSINNIFLVEHYNSDSNLEEMFQGKYKKITPQDILEYSQTLEIKNISEIDALSVDKLGKWNIPHNKK